MAEVLAGFVCGYIVALVAAPVAAVAAIRSSSTRLRAVVPSGTSVVVLSVVLHGFAFLLFTAVGMLLGALLATLEERAPEGASAAPTWSSPRWCWPSWPSQSSPSRRLCRLSGDLPRPSAWASSDSSAT